MTVIKKTVVTVTTVQSDGTRRVEETSTTVTDGDLGDVEEIARASEEAHREANAVFKDFDEKMKQFSDRLHRFSELFRRR